MRKDELLEEIKKQKIPTHIALILDGNGRWAKDKGFPRTYGHKKGADTLEEILIASANLGIKYLTAYVFSTENWSRPDDEVKYIMSEIVRICKNYKKLIKNNVKLDVIGSREKVEQDVLDAIDEAIDKTKFCNRTNLVLAFNYGSKLEIVESVKKIALLVKENKITIDDITNQTIEENLYTKNIPAVDLLIRTSGEIRISNFLLWQIAYAELYFTKTYWPDFHTKEYYQAIHNYQQRHRRYGGLEKK